MTTNTDHTNLLTIQLEKFHCVKGNDAGSEEEIYGEFYIEAKGKRHIIWQRGESEAVPIKKGVEYLIGSYVDIFDLDDEDEITYGGALAEEDDGHDDHLGGGAFTLKVKDIEKNTIKLVFKEGNILSGYTIIHVYFKFNKLTLPADTRPLSVNFKKIRVAEEDEDDGDEIRDEEIFGNLYIKAHKRKYVLWDKGEDAHVHIDESSDLIIDKTIDIYGLGWEDTITFGGHLKEEDTGGDDDLGHNTETIKVKDLEQNYIIRFTYEDTKVDVYFEFNVDTPFNLIIASDPQLSEDDKVHFRPKNVSRYAGVGGKEFNDWMVGAMNEIGPAKGLQNWPSTHLNGRKISEPKGVVINGDLTEYGKDDEYEAYKKLYHENLNLKIWPSLGNHDYQNNVPGDYHGAGGNDGHWTGTQFDHAIRMIEYIKEELWGEESGLFFENEATPNFGGFLNKDDKSLAYSFELGNYRFIHLNNYPTYSVHIDPYSELYKSFWIESSLPWLKKELKQATEARQKIVLFSHDVGAEFSHIKYETKVEWAKKDDEAVDISVGKPIIIDKSVTISNLKDTDTIKFGGPLMENDPGYFDDEFHGDKKKEMTVSEIAKNSYPDPIEYTHDKTKIEVHFKFKVSGTSPNIDLTATIDYIKLLKGDDRGGTAEEIFGQLFIKSPSPNPEFSDFCDVIHGHNVVAIFAGHIHNQVGYWGYIDVTNKELKKTRGTFPTPRSILNIPLFQSGGASLHTFLLAEFAESQMSVGVIDVTPGNKKFLAENCDTKRGDENFNIPSNDDDSLYLNTYATPAPEIEVHTQTRVYGAQPPTYEEMNGWYSLQEPNFDDETASGLKSIPWTKRHKTEEESIRFGMSGSDIANLDAGDDHFVEVTLYHKEWPKYSPVTARIPLEITKATPTVNWNNPNDIIYGTLLSPAQLNATASVPGTFTYFPDTGKKLDAGQQTLKVTFKPTSDNYSDVTKTVSLNVRKASPIIRWAKPRDITYGTRLGTAQFNATALVPGTFSYAPAAGKRLDAGRHTLTVTFTPDSNHVNNYTTASKETTIVVKKATPRIFWGNPGSIHRQTALDEAQLNAKANVNGSFTYAPKAGAVLEVGHHQPLKATFIPVDQKNYNANSKTVFLDVKGENLGTQVSFVNGRHANTGSRAGWFIVTEVDTKRVITKWYSSRGSKDSGPMTTLPLSFNSVHVSIDFHPDSGGNTVPMKVVNPAPDTPYGWVSRGKTAVIVVEYPH